jgi:hypothetical protein
LKADPQSVAPDAGGEAVEAIRGSDALLALIIRGAARGTDTAFFTPEHLALQVGRIARPAGSVIAAHAHKALLRSIAGTVEVLVVQQGRTLLDVYARDRKLVCTRELLAGDVAVLIAGGHGLRQLEDTVLIEVKQGPYHGAGEKELL